LPMFGKNGPNLPNIGKTVWKHGLFLSYRNRTEKACDMPPVLAFAGVVR
jgi:hypothetical protein